MSPYLCENVHTNSASNVKEYVRFDWRFHTRWKLVVGPLYSVRLCDERVFFNDEKLVPSGHNNGKKTWASTHM